MEMDLNIYYILTRSGGSYNKKGVIPPIEEIIIESKELE